MRIYRQLVILIGAALIVAACVPETPTPEVISLLPTPTPPVTPTLTATFALPTQIPSPTLPATEAPPPSPTPYPGHRIEFPNQKIEAGVWPAQAVARIGLGQIDDAALAPDGKLLAIGTATGIYLYDMETGKQIWGQVTLAPVVQVAWSPDSMMVAVRLLDWPNVLIWEGATGEYLIRLENGNAVDMLEWSPDSKRLFTGSEEYGRLWDVATGVVAQEVYQESEYTTGGDLVRAYYFKDILWLSTGTYVAAHYRDNQNIQKITLFNLESGATIREFLPADLPQGNIEHIATSPDNGYLAAYTGLPLSDAPRSDPRVFVWDINNNRPYLLDPAFYGSGVVLAVDWSPTSIQAGTGSENMVLLWNTLTGEVSQTFTQPYILFGALKWSPDGSRLAAGGQGGVNGTGTAVILDAATGEVVQHWSGFTGGVQRLQWVLKGDGLLAASQKEVALLDAAEGNTTALFKASLSTFFVHPRADYAIKWSPDGTRFTWIPDVGDDPENHEGGYYVWGTGGEVVDFQANPSFAENWLKQAILELPSSLISPDQTLSVEVKTVEDILANTILITDPAGQNVYNFQVNRVQFASATFSADSRWLAAGFSARNCVNCPPPITEMDDNFIVVWDMASGKEAARLYGHTGSPYYLSFSPDGGRLISVSADGTILIWRAGW